MINKTLKTLGTLVLLGIGINSFSQDTIRTAEGYIVKNKKGHLISDVRKRRDYKEIYEYNPNKGNLTKITIFSKGKKEKLYAYNEKGKLTTETIYNKEGKIEKVVNRNL